MYFISITFGCATSTLYKRNAGFIAKLNISPRNKNSYKMKVSSSKTRTTLILDR